jgi:hypothetical protein
MRVRRSVARAARKIWSAATGRTTAGRGTGTISPRTMLAAATVATGTIHAARAARRRTRWVTASAQLTVVQRSARRPPSAAKAPCSAVISAAARGHARACSHDRSPARARKRPHAAGRHRPARNPVNRALVAARLEPAAVTGAHDCGLRRCRVPWRVSRYPHDSQQRTLSLGQASRKCPPSRSPIHMGAWPALVMGKLGPPGAPCRPDVSCALAS